MTNKKRAKKPLTGVEIFGSKEALREFKRTATRKDITAYIDKQRAAKKAYAVNANKNEFRRERMYIIMSRNSDGELLALTNSHHGKFSKNEVYLFRPYTGNVWNRETGDGNFQEYKKEQREWYDRYAGHVVKQLRKRYPKSDIFACRVGSKKCPIKINWSKWHATPVKERSNSLIEFSFK